MASQAEPIWDCSSSAYPYSYLPLKLKILTCFVLFQLAQFPEPSYCSIAGTLGTRHTVREGRDVWDGGG